MITIRESSELDCETIPEYELTVVTAHKGRPSMKSTVKVKLTLEDVCDSKPKFEKDPYVVFLDEDVSENAFQCGHRESSVPRPCSRW